MTQLRTKLGLLSMGALIVAGCATTSTSPTAKIPDAEIVERPSFIPTNFVAHIQRDGGKYDTLISLPSHAVWVSESIAEIKKEYEEQNNPDLSPEFVANAMQISNDYIVIECHIETMFQDSSIAYDVSGLRNATLYLRSPNGTKIYPLQHFLLTAAEEKQVGTLKQFNRVNVLVFALDDIITGMPTLPDQTDSVRLYIEGFDTTFYFEWAAQEPIVLESLDPDQKLDIADVIRWRPTQTETYQVLKVRFTDLYQQLAALATVHRR